MWTALVIYEQVVSPRMCTRRKRLAHTTVFRGICPYVIQTKFAIFEGFCVFSLALTCDWMLATVRPQLASPALARSKSACTADSARSAWPTSSPKVATWQTTTATRLAANWRHRERIS